MPVASHLVDLAVRAYQDSPHTDSAHYSLRGAMQDVLSAVLTSTARPLPQHANTGGTYHGIEFRYTARYTVTGDVIERTVTLPSYEAFTEQLAAWNRTPLTPWIYEEV